MATVDEWWHTRSLHELDPQQWEALCDGCARCCLHKLEDEETGELFFTAVRCRYLDGERCRCTAYANRVRLVPNCVRLDHHSVADFHWLPATCAYRLRARGERLPDWHPLVSGDPGSVHAAGISVRGRTISERDVHPEGYAEYIVTWVN